MLKKLSENFKELQGSFKELIVNYTIMKKDIEIINETGGNENAISEMKNIVEGIKSRLDEAED